MRPNDVAITAAYAYVAKVSVKYAMFVCYKHADDIDVWWRLGYTPAEIAAKIKASET